MTTAELIRITVAYRRNYEAFVEEFMRNGTPEKQARIEARHAATALMISERLKAE